MFRLLPFSQLSIRLKCLWKPIFFACLFGFSCIQALGQTDASKDVFWLWKFIGRLHPMFVHFPIVLVFLIILFSIIDRYRGRADFQQTNILIAYISALGSVLATSLGLLLANTEEYGTESVNWHQWTGIATTALICMGTYLYYKGSRNLGFIIFILSAVSVSITGHFGSELTHGAGYLSEVLPAYSDKSETDENVEMAFIPVKGMPDEEQLQMLNVQVRSVFAHKCYSCHGPTRAKGDLRLDTKEGIFKGGEHGQVIKPGDPSGSEIIRRVRLPRGHEDAMPTKGNGLTEDEIEILSYWIEKGAPWPSGPVRSLFRTATLEPRLPMLPPVIAGHEQPIDRFVSVYFQEHGIQWKQPVDDRTYMRRVYLDIIGLLPDPDSVDHFAADPRPDKRSLLAKRLLARDHDYTQHWITFWNDVLRNDYSGPGYITKGRKDITRWLYQALLSNKSYDRFVRELIDADEYSEGFIRGIRWRGEVNASQYVEMQAAQNVSQVFFGLNLKCASCHDSFISDWKLDDAYAFANLFADSLLQIYRCDKPTGTTASIRMLYPKLGKIDSSADRKERLRQLANITVQPSNGRLYRTLVNRIWAQLMGRGIIEPVDAMDNSPWSQDLLDWLAWDFVAKGTDMKGLVYAIVTSDIYQQPSVSVRQPEDLMASGFVFQGMLRRRLSAEQFIDAIGSTLEPVYHDTLIERKKLPDGIQYCAPFTRASLVLNDPFQKSLGRPTRENVSTSRSSQASLLQALELTNGSLFHATLRRAANNMSITNDPQLLARQRFRKMLLREPVEKELRLLRQQLVEKPSADDWEDFYWVLALHPEFQLIY